MFRRAITILGLSLLSLTAAAEVYRWVDAQGNVHYSDRPAENAKQVPIQSRPTDKEAIAKTAQATQQKQQAVHEQEQKQAEDTNAAKAVEKDMVRIQEERCKKAEADYRTATQSQRLYRVGKNGEREYLSDAELTEARVNARKTLDACQKK